MANVKDFFTGNFLRAEDCKGGEIVEFLEEGSIEEIQSPEGKVKTVLNYPVSVDGKAKIFTPNKANGTFFMDAWGEDDKEWIGKKFQISLADVIVFGKKKKSIVANLIEEPKKGKL